MNINNKIIILGDKGFKRIMHRDSRKKMNSDNVLKMSRDNALKMSRDNMLVMKKRRRRRIYMVMKIMLQHFNF